MIALENLNRMYRELIHFGINLYILLEIKMLSNALKLQSDFL